MRVAVIPARGGSKRIPRKNIRSFCGRPMIAWSISAAFDAGIFERVIVSTEDEEIAEIAQREGAEVPFMRPDALADDMTATVPVIAHALSALETEGARVSTICCLYATAPFVRASDLVTANAMLNESEADYVLPVTSFAFPIQRAVRITDRNRVEMFAPKHSNTRSQDLEEAFHDAGQFYFGRAASWREGKTLIGPGSQPYRMPRQRVQDIDTPEDWERAELMFKAMHTDFFAD